MTRRIIETDPANPTAGTVVVAAGLLRPGNRVEVEVTAVIDD